jgi:hypothetical protein
MLDRYPPKTRNLFSLSENVEMSKKCERGIFIGRAKSLRYQTGCIERVGVNSGITIYAFYPELPYRNEAL